MLVVLWAGYTNATPTLFWLLYYTLKNPSVRREIENEIKTLLQSKKNEDKQKITLDDILELKKQDLDKLVITGILVKFFIYISFFNIMFAKKH